MLIENKSGETIYYTIGDSNEKCTLLSNEILEINPTTSFHLRIYQKEQSSYLIEKFTKCPKCTINISTCFLISNFSANTKIIITKFEHVLDYIFSYSFYCCSIEYGTIIDEFHIVENLEHLIAQHKKHLRKDLRHEYLIVPFALLDISAGLFLWKWYGFKLSLIVTIILIVIMGTINGIVTFLFSRFDSSNKKYLQYFDANFIKTIYRGNNTGVDSLS